MKYLASTLNFLLISIIFFILYQEGIPKKGEVIILVILCIVSPLSNIIFIFLHQKLIHDQDNIFRLIFKRFYLSQLVALKKLQNKLDENS